MKVMVVSIGGLHLGFVGAYGSDWGVTSNLDHLASEAVTFDLAFAEQPEGEAVRRGWWTGRSTIGRAEPPRRGADRDEPVVPAMLRAAGVQPILVTDRGPQLAADWSPCWGFDELFRAGPGDRFRDQAVSWATEWVAEAPAGDDWLLWVDLWGANPPWDAPPAARVKDREDAGPSAAAEPPVGVHGRLSDADLAQLHRAYAARVRSIDDALGPLFVAVRRHCPDAVMVVTGDHGMPLGEHDWVGDPAAGVHEESVHVPLIVRDPQHGERGVRSPALVQGPDLAATVLDLFGVAAAAVPSPSLLPLLAGRIDTVRESAFMAVPGRLYGIRTDQWYLIVPDPAAADAGGPLAARSLYAKPEDRWEQNDLAGQYPEGVDTLESALRQFLAAARNPGPGVVQT